MRIRELFEDGRIVKGVNTTVDVSTDEIKTQAAKFGFDVDKDGNPPQLSKKVKGASTNVAFNLGLTESQLIDLDQLDEGLKSKLASLGIAGALAAGGTAAYQASKTDTNIQQPKAQTIQVDKKQDRSASIKDLWKNVDTDKKDSKQDVEKSKKSAEYTPITNNKNEVILLQVAQAAGINSVELAAFMSQMAHESEMFTDMVEDISHEGAAKRYGTSRLAKILGNKTKTDAMRFKGRGFIQLTGRWNYNWMQKRLGIDLTSSWSAAQQASEPEIAARIAVEFWKQRVRPKVKNFSNVRDVTKPINPGLHGLESRNDKFQKVASAMNLN